MKIIRVLCVDDNRAGLEVRKHLLQVTGMAAAVTSLPLEALWLMTTEGFELAVIDYRMPGANGMELGTALKKMRPRLRMILLTGAVDLPAGAYKISTACSTRAG